MTEAIIRFGLDRNYSKRQVFTSSCCITACGLILMFIISPLMKLVSLLDFIDGYLILLLVYVCMSSFRSLCSQFVRAKGMVKLFSFDGILATLTLFVFNIVFISVLGMGVKGFMLSVILSDFLSAVSFLLLHVFMSILI